MRMNTRFGPESPAQGVLAAAVRQLAALPGMPLAAADEHVAQQFGPVGHDAVHPEVKQRIHQLRVVHRPDMHVQTGLLRPADDRSGSQPDRQLSAAHRPAGERRG